MSKTFIQADTVAEILGFASGAAFLRARPRLEDRGLPAPMPTCLRPLKWRRSAIEAWAEMQGREGNQSALPANVVPPRGLMEMAGRP